MKGVKPEEPTQKHRSPTGWPPEPKLHKGKQPGPTERVQTAVPGDSGPASGERGRGVEWRKKSAEGSTGTPSVPAARRRMRRLSREPGDRNAAESERREGQEGAPGKASEGTG